MFPPRTPSSSLRTEAAALGSSRCTGLAPGCRRKRMAVTGLEPRRVVRLEGDAVVLLDQRRLPEEEVELHCRSAAEVAEAIRTLAIRGAPATGVAAAYGYALAALRGEDSTSHTTCWSRRPDGGQPRVGARGDASRPDARARAGDPRRGGRALPAYGRACDLAPPTRLERAHALQHGQPRDRWVRNGARRDPGRVGSGARRACLGRRDAAAAPGSAPHGLGAGRTRDPLRGDRGCGRRRR